MDNFKTLLHDIWKAPGGVFYLGYYTRKTERPEYLLNLSVLLDYFAHGCDEIALLVAAQRLIIGYVQELNSDCKEPVTPIVKMDDCIAKVASFADVLDDAICRDDRIIDLYVNRETNGFEQL